MTDEPRPLRLEYVDPDTLADNPANWRTHPEAQTSALAAVIDDVGWAGALLYNERTERLIDGHARKKLKAGGSHEILFDGLAPGRWWYRAERFNEHGGTGYAGWDQPVEVGREGETRVAVDAWYPWEREKEKDD